MSSTWLFQTTRMTASLGCDLFRTPYGDRADDRGEGSPVESSRDIRHLTQPMEHWAANAARYRIVYRYPLLDRRVVEFALGLPPEFFLHNGRSRWFARQQSQQMSGML